ncbi:hypothetical protein CUMW_018840 [Citrus unshiu]|nr:hypothetical protein CUMW_018840 [Citrus unshiu]
MAAPPQARQSNKLVRVGKEAFSLLDETYGSPKESGRMLSSTQPRDPRHEDPGLRKPVIDSNQAAQFSGGAVIADYSTGKTTYSYRDYHY